MKKRRRPEKITISKCCNAVAVVEGVKPNFEIWYCSNCQKVCETHLRNKDIFSLYDELIMAVCRKFPNESRHQTAMRYIAEAEHKAFEGETQTANTAADLRRKESDNGN